MDENREVVHHTHETAEGQQGDEKTSPQAPEAGQETAASLEVNMTDIGWAVLLAFPSLMFFISVAYVFTACNSMTCFVWLVLPAACLAFVMTCCAVGLLAYTRRCNERGMKND